MFVALAHSAERRCTRRFGWNWLIVAAHATAHHVNLRALHMVLLVFAAVLKCSLLPHLVPSISCLTAPRVACSTAPF
jgi:hypothetical protein